MLELDIPASELEALVAHQVSNLFSLDASEREALSAGLPRALDRTEHCFSFVNSAYYRPRQPDACARFSPWQSSQYAIFLYYLSNEAVAAHARLADKLYYLNKALNGVDLFHAVAMPAIFALDHPVGTVIGRATIGDRFFFQQTCTVGNNNNRYPFIGRNVTMLAGSSVIGACHVGDNVIFAANSYLQDTDVPANSIVFGQWPNIHIRPAEERHFANLAFFTEAPHGPRSGT